MDQKFDSIRLVTLDEAAAILQVSKRTLQRMIKINELPAFKVGGQWRLRQSQLRQWVEQRESSVTEGEKSAISKRTINIHSGPADFYADGKSKKMDYP